VPVLAHRLLLAGSAQPLTPEDVVTELVERLPVAMRRLGSQT